MCKPAGSPLMKADIRSFSVTHRHEGRQPRISLNGTELNLNLGIVAVGGGKRLTRHVGTVYGRSYLSYPIT
jgi:hypothetical protein